MRQLTTLLIATAIAASCATLGPLGSFVQAPRFEDAPDRQPEFRLTGPSAGNALGGATVRLWTRITNPNPFGFTLASLTGTLYLDDATAATTEFPLGVPLSAGASTVIPIDLAIDFSDLPQIVNAVRRAARREPVTYQFNGTVGVDAGRLGTPYFGPMTFVRGEIN
jgi:hypothetical protein